MYCYSTEPLKDAIFTNNLVASNDAERNGSGMFLILSARMRITNCTITDNRNVGICGENHARPRKITNSIIWGNVGGDLVITGGQPPPDVTYSDIGGGWLGQGNIDEEPLFVSGPLGDYYLQQGDSPCVDAGHPDYFPFKARTTSPWHDWDVYPIDMGYHYPALLFPARMKPALKGIGGKKSDGIIVEPIIDPAKRRGGWVR